MKNANYDKVHNFLYTIISNQIEFFHPDVQSKPVDTTHLVHDLHFDDTELTTLIADIEKYILERHLTLREYKTLLKSNLTVGNMVNFACTTAKIPLPVNQAIQIAMQKTK